MRRLVAILLLLPFLPALPAARVQAAAPRPNVVIFLTDDQRWDQLARMATVQSRLVGKGVTFTNGFVEDPLCCPSRISILRGQAARTTRIYGVAKPYGGFALVRSYGLERSTLATWLHAAGYRTALIGKYLNGYGDGTYVPPGWDYWRAMMGIDAGGGYYNYRVSENGTAASYGDAPADYSTDVLANYADRFIRSTPASKPLFLELSFRAPHDPTTPAPRNLTDPRCASVTNYPPSFNEADVSDKPAYIRNLPSFTQAEQTEVGTTFPRNYCRALLSVDEAVAKTLEALRATGRLGDTFIVFTSDNGNLLGEHRWIRKKVPYEESIRVPFVIRYDPLTANGATDAHLVLNIDLASTIAAVARVTPGVRQDGRSLIPLLDGTVGSWRTDFLVEHADAASSAGSEGYVPTYCGVRAKRFTYVRYITGERELYDRGSDPYQLRNLASDPSFDAKEAAMEARLKQLCQPPPPEYRA